MAKFVRDGEALADFGVPVVYTYNRGAVSGAIESAREFSGKRFVAELGA